MGGINSKENNYREQATPPRLGPVQGRLLDFDPRSPSIDITRTPIQVDKTPDSIQFDPRSPSIGIVRTPLGPKISGKSEKISAFTQSTEVLIEPADQYTEESIMTGSPQSPAMVTALESSLEESGEGAKVTGPLLAMTLKELPEVEKRSEPLSESIDLLNIEPTSETASLIPVDTSAPYESKENVRRSKTSKSTPNKFSTQPKELFPFARKQIAIIPDQHKENIGTRSPTAGTRSPLSMRKVDVNSPRNIVQRKQVKKLDVKKLDGMNRSCTLEAAYTRPRCSIADKENM